MMRAIVLGFGRKREKKTVRYLAYWLVTLPYLMILSYFHLTLPYLTLGDS